MMDPIYEIELEDCPFCGGPGVMQEENGWRVCGVSRLRRTYRLYGI